MYRNKNGAKRGGAGAESSQSALEVLEGWRYSETYMQREVGFCAQWCLDNLCKNLTK